MHKYLIIFLSLLTIIITISTLTPSADATKNISVATDNYTEESSCKENNDIENLLDSANLPVLCAIIGIAMVGTTYFRTKKRNEYHSDDYQKYNEKSYYTEENTDN